MEENEKSKTNEQFDRTNFLENLIRNFINKEGRASVDAQYRGYVRFLDDLKQKDGKEREAEERRAILDKVYEMFSDSDIRKIISEKGITASQFISQFIPKYGEKILGDNKRKYKMNEMYDSRLIATKSNSKSEKAVSYKGYGENKVKDENERVTSHIFTDVDGNEIRIERIGELKFIEFNGVENDISKYKLTKNNTIWTDVYSRINFTQMDNPMYRQAVLYELLTQNNIELSKAGGYIGQIVKIPKEDTSLRKLRRGESLETSLTYIYKINDEYVIEYNASDLSAVIIQSMKDEKDKEVQESSSLEDTR